MVTIAHTKLDDRNCDRVNGECRARSDCTYVQADLALHSQQDKAISASGMIRANVDWPSTTSKHVI